MDRMIAAFATAQSPKALERWARRQGLGIEDREKAAASNHAITRLARLFPEQVKVN